VTQIRKFFLMMLMTPINLVRAYYVLCFWLRGWIGFSVSNLGILLLLHWKTECWTTSIQIWKSTLYLDKITNCLLAVQNSISKWKWKRFPNRVLLATPFADQKKQNFHILLDGTKKELPKYVLYSVHQSYLDQDFCEILVPDVSLASVPGYSEDDFWNPPKQTIIMSARLLIKSDESGEFQSKPLSSKLIHRLRQLAGPTQEWPVTYNLSLLKSVFPDLFAFDAVVVGETKTEKKDEQKVLSKQDQRRLQRLRQQMSDDTQKKQIIEVTRIDGSTFVIQ
jgi:hypothetical protein